MRLQQPFDERAYIRMSSVQHTYDEASTYVCRGFIDRMIKFTYQCDDLYISWLFPFFPKKIISCHTHVCVLYINVPQASWSPIRRQQAEAQPCEMRFASLRPQVAQ